MVAVGELWEGHELLNEERGMVRHFLARQLGDTSKLVWLHLGEGARLDEGAFAEEIARLQRLSDEIPEIVRVLYGGVRGSVAWAASPVLSDATPIVEAAHGHELGPAALKALIDIGDCLVRANERDFYHGALSPDRVFIMGDGRYAITHFGFVRLFQLGAEEARQDPYGYAAPELFSGGRIGRRTDVYGFGTLMYELLCKRPFSAGTWPPSFPSGIPSMLQRMMKKSLDGDPRRRQVSVRKVLAALIPFAREWEELGEPPEAPFAHIFSEPSGSRRKPDGEAPRLVEDEWEPFASGEAGERSSARPTPRPSDAPATLKSVIPPRGDVIHAPPVVTSRPSDVPDTLKSVVPPRDDITHASPPPGAPPLPSAPTLPELDPPLPDPLLLVPPARSTPLRSPIPPVPPARSTPLRSNGTPGRRSAAHRLGAVLALAFLLGSSGALLLWWEQSPRSAAPHLARVVQRAALRATLPPPPPPSDAPHAPHAPPPVAPRSVTNRQAAVTRQAMKTPSMGTDICEALVACGEHRY